MRRNPVKSKDSDSSSTTANTIMPEKTFQADLDFLRSHFTAHVLKNDEGARAAVVPELQGRTMTCSSNGDEGQSYGYIKYDAFGQETLDPQINLYGGEDRIWISPEGGQFSVFFDPDVPMTYENWRTPPVLDSETWDVSGKSDTSITFEKSKPMMNMSGFTFDLKMHRQINLLDRQTVAGHLKTNLNSLSVVGHESINTLANGGDKPWKEETGLIGLWLISMNKPSPTASLIVPFRKGDVADLGKIVEANYFGELDSSRLVVNEEAGLIFLKGDGDFRSKLGLSQQRALPYMGSWDAQRQVLTVVQFNMPAEAPHGYTNNLWEFQEQPFAGDVINGYNDGPNESGGKLGGFYELETVSPALALQPGESFMHLHRTVRMAGDRSELDAVCNDVFGVSLDLVESQLG